MSALTPRIDQIESYSKINAIINGAMDFFQRGGAYGASAINLGTSFAYNSADRFLFKYTGTVTGTPTIIQDITVPNTLTKYSAKIGFRRNASTFTLSAQQRIEGITARDLIGTSSFQIQGYCQVAGMQARLTLYYPTAEDNHASQTQFYQSSWSTAALASTWTQFKFEGLTIPSDCTKGIAAVIEFQVPTGTDGSAQYMYLTQVGFTPGSFAYAFSRNGRSIAEELIACQRFFNFVGAGASGQWTWNGSPSQVALGIQFPVEMRSVPSTPPTLTSNSISIIEPRVAVRSAVPGHWETYASISGAYVQLTFATACTVNNPAMAQHNFAYFNSEV